MRATYPTGHTASRRTGHRVLLTIAVLLADVELWGTADRGKTFVQLR